MSGPNFKPKRAWDDTFRTSSIKRLERIAVVKSTIEKALRTKVYSWFGSRTHHQLEFLDSQWNREFPLGDWRAQFKVHLTPQDLTMFGKVRRACILRLCYAQWQASVKEKNGYDAISFPACEQMLLHYGGRHPGWISWEVISSRGISIWDVYLKF